MSGERERDAQRVVSVMNEIGVGGLNLEVVMDNESSLQYLVNAALVKSNCRSLHPRHVAVARPAPSTPILLVVMKESQMRNMEPVFVVCWRH